MVYIEYWFPRLTLNLIRLGGWVCLFRPGRGYIDQNYSEAQEKKSRLYVG